MNKKYFPWIALLAAALFLFWVKKNQRKSAGKKIMATCPHTVERREAGVYVPSFMYEPPGMPVGSALIL